MNIGQAQWWGWIISWEVDSCLEPAFHHCFSSVPKNPCVSVLSPSCIDGGKLQLFIVFLLLLFSCCHVWLSGIPCITAWPAFLSFTISLSFLKLMSIESVAISSSVAPFSSCPQFFPASESFPGSQLFASSGQSIGASVSARVFPMNIQGWHPLGLTALFSLQLRDSEELLQHHSWKASVIQCLKNGWHISSVQFSCSGMSNSLWPHELQHARSPCPSPTPRVHSNSRPSSQWCHPAISSPVVPFSSCPQSLPALESFPIS